jgi:VCBS repeat-containing protein
LKQTANHGQVDVNDTGQLSYQPNDNFFGSDQLTLLLSDNQGGSQSVTLTITVEPVNDVPNFELEKYSVDEDTSYTGQLYATDIEQHDIIFGVVIGSAFQGEVIITTDGQFTFTPDQDFFGFASFDAQVIDSAQGIRQQTIAILVNPVDDSPVFDELTVAVNHNGEVSDNLPTQDIDGDVLEYTLAEDVTNGSLTFNNGEYSYSPNSGFSGSDSFSFEVTDGSNTVTSTILFSVQAAPLVNNPSPSVTDSTPSKSGGSVHYFYLILLFISFGARKRLSIK